MKISTKNLLNWKPEAEGERQQMSKLYTDLLGIEDAINNNEFIIMGRKGSGKSAYAVHLQALTAEQRDVLFCETIDSHTIQLEKLITEVDDGTPYYTTLLEWLILTKFVNLILNTEDGRQNRNYQDLLYFHRNTSGHIKFTKDTINETIKTREFNISPLEKINIKAGRQTTNKSYKASFFTMVESLREAVCETLAMPVYKKYKFYLLIDDLDVDFSLKNIEARKRLLALIRIVCKYNTNYLCNTSSRILVFVRNDIANKLSNIGGDSQKMLDSYGYTINWYQDVSEDYLYKMINHRLNIAFQEREIPIPSDKDAWSLFAKDGYSQFKRLLDYTFYLPRDIINILNRSKNKDWELPIGEKEFDMLIEEYSPRKYEEICNELSAYFDPDEIEDIKMVLYKIAKEIQEKGNLSYREIMSIFATKSLSEIHFQTIVEHDLLIPMDKHNKTLLFSYRKKKVFDSYEEYFYALPKVLYELFCS